MRNKAPNVPFRTAVTHSSVVHFFPAWNTMEPHPPGEMPPQNGTARSIVTWFGYFPVTKVFYEINIMFWGPGLGLYLRWDD